MRSHCENIRLSVPEEAIEAYHSGVLLRLENVQLGILLPDKDDGLE